MRTLEKLSMIDQLNLVYFGGLMKRLDQPFSFDFTPKTFKITSLRREILAKYSSNEGGVYRFFFTPELVEELNGRTKTSTGPDVFCIALYCEGAEQPCVLTSAEWREIASGLGDMDDLNLTIKIEGRSFKISGVSDRRFEKTISKKACLRKLLH